MGDWGNFGKRKAKFGKWPYYAPNPLSLAPSDLPPPIGPLTTAHDLCRYPSGLEGLGACAPAQSRYSFHDGLNLRYRGGIRKAPEAGDFGVEKRLLTPRSCGTRSRAQSPDAGRGRAAKARRRP